MFVHFGMATWQHREYDNHTTDLSRVNPSELNTDQWCEVAKSWGARMILFVAKHTGGFCWWQTQTSDYGVKEIPWRGGKGDVMADLSRSCKKYGLKLGVYIYPGDDHWGAGIGSGGICEDPSLQEAYNKIFRQQLTEVLFNYGKISEVWFDGNCKIPVSDILAKYAKDAVVFQGSDASLRWVGNEDGVAPYPNWYTLKHEDLKTGTATALASDAWGDSYAPVEIDVPMLKNNGHKWFWAPNTEDILLTTSQLMRLYYNSVGRGSVLLLNSTPDTTGLIPQSHAERYASFGKEIESRFSTPLKAKVKSKANQYDVIFPNPTKLNHIVISEDLRHGQTIHEFNIEYLKDGHYIPLIQQYSIGSKRIIFFDEIETSAIRLVITKYRGKKPARLDIKVYNVKTDLDDLTLISNHQEQYQIGFWQQEDFSDILEKEICLDLTPYMSNVGEYILEFKPIAYDYSNGKSWGLDFNNISLEIYGKQHNDLIEKINDWEFKIIRSQQTLDEYKTIFKARISHKGASSCGEIRLRRITSGTLD